MNDYLDMVKAALREVGGLGPALDMVIEKGEQQARTRAGVIQTLNEMCDALQLANDLIAKELSAAITEFHRLPPENAQLTGAYFERVALRFSETSLRLLLHEGRVCGELHTLGDRFEQPFSGPSIAALSVWENVKTVFTRSNAMSGILHGLLEGERDYLRSFSAFLNDVRDRAELATRAPGADTDLRKAGQALVQLMRDKRASLQAEFVEIRALADKAISALH